MGIIPLTPRVPGLEFKNVRICIILVQKCNAEKDSTALHYRYLLCCRVNSGSNSDTILWLTVTHSQNSFTCIWAAFKSSQDHMDCTQNLSSAVKSPECWQNTQLAHSSPKCLRQLTRFLLTEKESKQHSKGRSRSQDITTHTEKYSTTEETKTWTGFIWGRAEREEGKAGSLKISSWRFIRKNSVNT